jgi:hypothetical protein
MPPGPCLVSPPSFHPALGFRTATRSGTCRTLYRVSQSCIFSHLNKTAFCVDSVFSFQYSVFMKWLNVLLLVVLLHDIFAPQPVTPGIQKYDHASVGTLDVCHESASEFTDDDEMPGVAEQHGTAMPVRPFTYCPSSSPLLITFLLTAQHERPPKA